MAAIEGTLSGEASNFISKLDSNKVESRVLFKDRLVTLSENTGKEVGELTVSVERSTYTGRECYLVQASSNGVVDTVPVGTNITAYVSPSLETMEHTQYEYVNMPGNTLTKKSILSVEEDGGYNFNLTNTADGQDTTVTQQFTPDEMAHFISEGANIVLQRLAVVLGMKSRMSFRALGVNNSVVPVTYAMLESRSISVQNVTLDCVGVERTLEDEEPTTWQLYFLNDGHMYTRSQIDSPVYMKIKSLPETFLKDEEADWVFPDFGKGRLNWEDDLEMYSLFLDRKEELKEDHVSYMRRHPELKAILGDFLQFLLMRKPSDVIEFAADFFSSYSSSAELKPTFAHSEFVNKSAIRTE